MVAAKKAHCKVNFTGARNQLHTHMEMGKEDEIENNMTATVKHLIKSGIQLV